MRSSRTSHQESGAASPRIGKLHRRPASGPEQTRRKQQAQVLGMMNGWLASNPRTVEEMEAKWKEVLEQLGRINELHHHD